MTIVRIINTVEELQEAINLPEGISLDFKEAKERFGVDEAAEYACALANVGGGALVLGVSDKRPRRIVGSKAFLEPGKIETQISVSLNHRVSLLELHTTEGRVVVLNVPCRPQGVPVVFKGRAFTRCGESRVHMSADEMARIVAERVPDYSAQLVPGASFESLSQAAITEFQSRWARKASNPAYANSASAQVLEDAGLCEDGQITYAALILLGSEKALSRHLANAEVVYEYRPRAADIPYQHRRDFRGGLLLWFDELWAEIDQRNERQTYQEGFFRYEMTAFSESVVREAVLNAVAHRDYHLQGSVFLRHAPHQLKVQSPGGFPPTITIQNILDRQNPRNRRLAEAMAKIGLVERSGQGADIMFRDSIKRGGLPPNFSGSDDHTVDVVLDGEVRDPRFLRFLSELGEEKVNGLGTWGLVALDLIHRGEPLPPQAAERSASLVQIGAIEKTSSRGRYILSRRLYAALDQRGVYTRQRGLDAETNKQLLLRHIRDNARDGSPMRDLLQVLPNLSRDRVKRFLYELREQGLIRMVGTKRSALWRPSDGT